MSLISLRPGDTVRYAGADYEVAEIRIFPHGPMVGIKDEPPGEHIDWVHPESVERIS